MEWIVIEKFEESMEDHIRLFTALAQGEAFFLVRKEWLEFDEMNQIMKQKFIDGNYEFYKEGILFFNDNNTKKRVELKILNTFKEIGNKFISTQETDIDFILSILERKEYAAYLMEIKNFITDLYIQSIEDKNEKRILKHQDYLCRTTKDMSHKYYGTDEDFSGCEYFDWYRLNEISDLEEFICDNFFNYNIIVTQHNEVEERYMYYINFYEGDNFTLAIKDNKGDFVTKFNEVFGPDRCFSI